MAPTLTLPSELTIYTVGELHPQWLAWAVADDDEAMHADASAVAEVDGAGLQLVLALERQLQRSRRTLAIARPSEPFAAACRALGVQHLLAAAPV